MIGFLQQKYQAEFVLIHAEDVFLEEASALPVGELNIHSDREKLPSQVCVPLS